MMVRAKKQRWPDKPVGRKELGEALGHGDQEIGNLFDGTRNLNARLFATLWERLCQTVARREPFYFPWPLLLAAICCQNLLINQHPNRKLIGGLLRDHANYTRIWNWHRQRWASQLSQGTEGWPAWLDS
jgi:hypothetical protein